MHQPPTRASVVLIFAVIGLLVGCAGPRHFRPEKDPDALSDEAFHGYLADLSLVSVDEAYRAIVILECGQDTMKNFEARRDYLEGKGISRSQWGLQQDHVIDAGSVAYMVCRVCRISGGVNHNLFGRAGLGDRRYALRELIYRKMWEDAGDHQYITGGMLMTLLSKMDEYMANKGMYEMSVRLSDETDRDQKGELIVPPPVEVAEPILPPAGQPPPPQ